MRSPELSLQGMVLHGTVSSWIMSPGLSADGAELQAGSGGDTSDTGTLDTSDTGAGAIDTGLPGFSVIINEVLADPDPTLGDTNCDGLVDTADDEFVEIVNNGTVPVDLTGATLSDAVGVKHTFGPTFLRPGDAVVVWGAGTPTFDGSGAGSWCTPRPAGVVLQTATSGNLGLTNTGDEVILTGPLGTELDHVTYGGEGGQDESVNRDPELTDSPLVLHTSVSGATEPWSPGTLVDGSAFGGGVVQNGLLVLNEFLADPGSVNDSNCDGVFDSTQDEFIELVNLGPGSIDLSGATIADASTVRFTVPAGTIIPAYDALVVYGGGTPTCPNVDGIALTGGSLSLNNTGDTIRVTDALGNVLIDYTYGAEANNDASQVLAPELTGTVYVSHAGAAGSLGTQSAGTLANGQPFESGAPVDTGADTGLDTGADTGLDTGVDTGLDTAVTWPVDALAPGDLVITEIMQNPDAVADNDGEWFEIHNPGGTALDITGLQIGDDASLRLQVTAPTIIAAGGYLVVGRGTDTGVNGGVSVDIVYTASNFANGADAVVIATGTGAVIDQVAYDGGPVFPDPTGASMSLDPSRYDAVANDDGASWCEAVDAYGLGDLGTPGAANPSCTVGDTGDTGSIAPTGDTGTTDTGTTDTGTPVVGNATLIINEVLADPGAFDGNCDGTIDTTDDEFVEIVNLGPEEANLSGVTVSDAGAVRFTFPPGTTLPVLDAAVVYAGGVSSCPLDGQGFVAGGTLSLNNTSDTVTVSDASGTVLDTVTYGSEAGADASVVRDPELSASALVAHDSVWPSLASPGTRGSGDAFEVVPPVNATLVLNEFLADPGSVNDANCDGTPSSTQDEFVELVNLGPDALDLSGYTIRDATTVRFTVPPGTVIAANDALVVYGGGTAACPNVDGTALVGGTLSLNNTADTIVVADAVGTVLISYTYGAEADNDASQVLAPELTGTVYVSHAGAAGSLGTQSAGTLANGQPFESGAPVGGDTGDTGVASTGDTGSVVAGIVLNEIFADANLVDANCDGTPDTTEDEFVEIVNAGSTSVDLTGAVLSDGTADRITFPALVLAPGDAVLVFGGGTPTFDGSGAGAWCGALPASVTVFTATLGLNNSLDTVTLRDAASTVLAATTYGAEAGNDTSIVLDPELTGTTYVMHDTVVAAPVSPGTRADGSML